MGQWGVSRIPVGPSFLITCMCHPCGPIPKQNKSQTFNIPYPFWLKTIVVLGVDFLWTKRQYESTRTWKTRAYHFLETNPWEFIAQFGMLMIGLHRVGELRLIGPIPPSSPLTRASKSMHVSVSLPTTPPVAMVVVRMARSSGGTSQWFQSWMCIKAISCFGFEPTIWFTITVLILLDLQLRLLNVFTIATSLGSIGGGNGGGHPPMVSYLCKLITSFFFSFVLLCFWNINWI